MGVKDKQEVFNPAVYQSTVGQELESIILSNGFSLDEIRYSLNIVHDFSEIRKFTKGDLSIISQKIDIPNFGMYLWNFQNNYSVEIKKADNTFKEYSKIFKKVRHLKAFLRDEFNEGMDELEDIATFLEIEDETKIFDSVNQNIALYKITNFEPDNLNLYAWLKRGEWDYRRTEIPNYNRESFVAWLNSGEWKKGLTDVNYFLEMPYILRQFGICFVPTAFLPKTVFGAVRWFDNKPLVQVSDRGNSLASAWYTLFHEFGHILLHQEIGEIIDGIDLSKTQTMRIEKQANSFAFDYLFNGDKLRRYIFMYSGKNVEPNFIYETARQFGVNPMFVAFWMKKARVISWEVDKNLPKLQLD